jgi:hypothetical protein
VDTIQTEHDYRPVEIDVDMTAFEWTRFSLTILYRQRKGFFWLMLFVSLYGVYQVYRGQATGSYWGALVPIFAIVAIAASGYFGAKYQMKKEKAFASTRRFQFSDAGLTVSIPGQSTVTDWANISKAVETNWAIMLYESQSRAYPIPKRCFGEGDQLNRFRQLLIRRLGERANVYE